MSRRPFVVLQSGDAFDNRTRVLPVAIACRRHGWAPVVLVDDIGAASVFALHDVACLAVGDLPDLGRADRPFDPDDLCALHLLKCTLTRRPMEEKDWQAALATTSRLWRMLEALAPEALFVWNGYTGTWANALRLYKADHGLPGGFMERGPVLGGAFVDELGVNGHASIAYDGEPAGAPTAFDGPSSGGDPPDTSRPPRVRDKVLFVPLQVHDDSNVLLHSTGMTRMRELVNFAIRLAERLGDDWRVLARPHPEERPSVRLNLPLDARLTLDAETNLETQIAQAAVCLTINSTVGLEAALGGCVTVCFGEGIYCRRNFVVAAQSCDMEVVLREIGPRFAAEASHMQSARDFMSELRARSLFWLGPDDPLAAAKLTRFGLDAGAATRARQPSGNVRIARPGAAYRAMLARLQELKIAGHEIVADFDFEPDDRLFVSYRRNRDPLTRGRLEARAAELFGRSVRLSRTHRALGSEGRVLMTHSRRAPQDIDCYQLVLDEFGLPHARVYLDTRASVSSASDAA